MKTIEEIKKIFDKNKINYEMTGMEIAIPCPFCKKMVGNGHQLIFNINPDTENGQCNGCYESCSFEELLKKLKITVEESKQTTHKTQKKEDKEFKEEIIEIISLITNNALVETIYDPKIPLTSFVIKDRNTGEIQQAQKYESKGKTYIPYHADHPLIRRQMLLLPSELGEKMSDDDLAAALRTYIVSYISVSPVFTEIIPYYAMFTWAHDRFDTIPYMRFVGDYGTGKSRLLKVIGSVCYKAFFASGAATPSPIFRLLDELGVTLIIDEADFQESDARSLIIKILNIGFEKDGVVMRSELDGKKRYRPEVFRVFGPKILAARQHFKDDALESRCLTEFMDLVERENHIPKHLPPESKKQALELRNLLLRWRLDNFDRILINPKLDDPSIPDRLNQIATPLKSIVSSPDILARVTERIQQYGQELIEDRADTLPAQILETILKRQAADETLTIGGITSEYNFGRESMERVGTNKAGSIIGKVLKLKKKRQNIGYVILNNQYNAERIIKLTKKYGLEKIAEEIPQDEHGEPRESDATIKNIDEDKVPMF